MTDNKSELILRFLANETMVGVNAQEMTDIIRDELIRLRAENASLRKIEAKVREILNRAPYEGGVHYYEGATDAATEILAAGSVDE